jgi:3-phenylpropionate/trans-cinnamate dioxygenase ferredoxin reductase subunit
MEKERLFLRPSAFYLDQDITLRLGCAVTAISTDDKTVTLGNEVLHYDDLVFTTGSEPRRLPPSCGGNLAGVYVIRGLADVDDMASEFTKGRHVLIVGGGYLGLEAAAVAAKLGLKVTLLEVTDRILQRVAAPETSDYFRDLHKSHGVDIREGVGLDHLLGDTRVFGAKLTDGTQIDIDLVIAGVGIAPADRLASNAGIEIENGIKTNAMGQTSEPYIWAAGDCASFPSGGKQCRLESVQNAIDQSELVAENLMGAVKEYHPKPWFWSDQYDVKLQIAGLNTGYDSVITRKGENRGSASHWYYKGDTLIAVDAMNDPRAFMIAKRLIAAGNSPAPDIVANQKTDLKALMNV